jgi:hypothetical protein
MKKVADFLLYAQRCEQLEKATRDDATRLSMRETAKQWRDMAAQRQLLLQVRCYRMICDRANDP